MPEEKRKVLSLIRVSSTDQAADDRTGIERQQEDINIHCALHKLVSVRTFSLQGISGAYVLRSPQFQEMLTLLREDTTIIGLVFASLDRFFRPKNLSSYQVFSAFESNGKHLFCDLGELKPDDEQDQMRIMIWGQMAGMERTRIRDRMMRGKGFKRLDPHSKTDPLPKGVEFIPPTKDGTGRFEYTEASERVKDAFKRLLKGESLQSISEELQFGSATALRITLKSQWWIGIKASMKYRKYEKDRKTREDGTLADGIKEDRPVPIRVPTNLAVRPLVSQSDFDTAQSLLTNNHKTWTQRKSRGNNFLATGLLFCTCGEKVYHKLDSRPGKPSYYMCASRWNGRKPCGHQSLNAEHVDQDIMWAVMTYLTDQRFVQQQIQNLMSDEGRAEKEQLVVRIEKSIGNLEKKLERAVDFALDNPEFIDRVKALRTQLAAERITLARSRSDLATHLDKRDISKMAKAVREQFWKFDEWSIDERKRVLNEHVSRIVFDENGKVEMTVRGGRPHHIKGVDLFQRYLDEMDEDVEELGYA
jgi:DNA invertase Pin-like site-specific DNA recombinase